MKKEKDFSRKSNLSQLSDDEILQGFKDADARIVREYYYGYCRVAYCIYDKRYDLQSKPGKDVAMQLGMTASAVTQRCQKMMHDVVIPYFKKYFDASEYRSYLSFGDEDASVSSAPKMSMSRMMDSRMCCEESADISNNIFNN